MATVSSGGTSEKFGFIALHGRELGVRYLCDWLGVSARGYYAWRNRRPSQRYKDDQALLKVIKRLFAEYKGLYGSPRIHQVLRRMNIRVGRKRVERLMREAGLVARVARIYRRMPGTTRFFMKHKNLKLTLPFPKSVDEQWVADLTYIKVSGRWRYLAVVMDLYSRRVIGWSLSEYKNAELTVKALRHALRHRLPKEGLIMHTDRGVEYGADLMQIELERYGIKASMNRPGVCTDNAHMESFFHSLKSEKLKGSSFKNEQELRMVLNHYINHFYNTKRLHSGIGYKTPVEYETMAA